MLSLKQFILYENNDFLILNKPSGISAHSGGDLFSGHNIQQKKSLLDLLSFEKIGTTVRKFKLFHRLDCETSGCILIIKTISFFNSIFCLQNVYHCIVYGLFKEAIVINIPIKKIDLCFFSTRTIIIPMRYIRNKYTILKVIPLSGRKHQILLHLSSINYPIFGDD